MFVTFRAVDQTLIGKQESYRNSFPTIWQTSECYSLNNLQKSPGVFMHFKCLGYVINVQLRSLSCLWRVGDARRKHHIPLWYCVHQLSWLWLVTSFVIKLSNHWITQWHMLQTCCSSCYLCYNETHHSSSDSSEVLQVHNRLKKVRMTVLMSHVGWHRNEKVASCISPKIVFTKLMNLT